MIAGEAKLAGQGQGRRHQGRQATEYTAKNIVLATGARARALPGLEPDGKLVWTYREAMVPDMSSEDRCWWSGPAPSASSSPASSARSAPRSRWSKCWTACCRWKTKRFPSWRDKAFIKQGMKIKIATTVEKLEKGADSVTATLKTKDGKTETITVDRVILAVGIVGNVENIGLEAGRREGGPHPCRRRPMGRDRRAGHLGHRRSGRPALAGAQGDA